MPKVMEKEPFAPPDWPALNAKPWPLEKIKPYDKNPKDHPEHQVAVLAELMTRWGVDQPIVVDEKGVILKGHGRLLAAKRAGFKEFPVVQHLGLDAAEKREMRIADNQSALLGGWNEELLSFELRAIAKTGANMELIGFDAAELRLRLDPWGSDIDVGERFGANLDGVKARLQIYVDRENAEKATKVIGDALTKARISFEA